MMEFGIPEPLVLDGNIKKNYAVFVEDFTKYINARGIQEETAKNELFYFAMGNKARELCKSFDLPSTATTKEIIDRFQAFTESYRDNVLYYSYKFQQLTQNENETIPEFLKKIHVLADKCKFTDKERMIIDKIIFGLKSQRIREEIFIRGYKQLDEIISFLRESENDQELNVGVISQSVPIIKTERDMDIPEEENDRAESRNHGTVTSSQELASDLINQDTVEYLDISNWEDDFNLEKGEVSTSTANNFSNFIFRTEVKREEEQLPHLQNSKDVAHNNRKSQGEVKEQSSTSPREVQTDSAYDVITIDSGDEDESELARNAEKSLLDAGRKPEEKNSKHTCSNCEKDFEDRDTLLSHILICSSSSVEKRKERISSSSTQANPLNNAKQPAKDQLFKDVQNSKKSVNEKDRPKPIKCPKCFKAFPFVCRLKKHLETGCAKKKKNLVSESLRKKYKKIIEKKLASSQKINSIQSKFSVTCSICHKSFTQRGNLTRHINTVHKKKLGDITNKFPNIKPFRGNVTIDDVRIHKCDFCPRSYRHRRSLLSHVKKSHSLAERLSIINQRNMQTCKKFSYINPTPIPKPLVWTCVMCFQKFDDKRKLEAHEATHQISILASPLPSPSTSTEAYRRMSDNVVNYFSKKRT